MKSDILTPKLGSQTFIPSKKIMPRNMKKKKRSFLHIVYILPSSAKPQLDGLVLFLVNPATHKTTSIFWKMEDDLSCKIDGRQPQF
jgi:hypothetical protein